jgi:membrane protein implicated in regulation of membrane protease activity
MDHQTWLALIIVGALVLLVIVYRYRKSISISFSGHGVKGSVSASNAPTAGVTAENIKSRSGRVAIKDTTGRGVVAQDVDARKDVEISANKDDDPKV